MDHPSRGDWVKTVTEDTNLEINLMMDQIEGTDKSTFKEIIKSKVQRKAFEHPRHIGPVRLSGGG